MRLHYSTIVLVFIFLMFIGDGATTLLLNFDSPIWRISIVLRFVVQSYFLVLLLSTSKGKQLILLLIAFYMIFLLGSYATFNMYRDYDIVGNFSIINKMFFFFICLEVFGSYLRRSEHLNLLLKLYEVIVVIEVISVVFGFVFGLHYFASYPNGERFGYKGLIPAINEVSGFFLIAFFYYLWKIIHCGQGVIILTAITVAGLLTGAKVALILPVMLSAYMFKWFIGVRIKKTYLWLGTIIVLLAIVAALGSNYLLSHLLPSINYFTDLWIQGRTISSLFMSGRDLKVDYLFSDILPKFNFINYLFGGLDLTDFSTETDVIDVFARLGLVGGLFFYYLYVQTLLGNIRAIPFTRLLFVLVWLVVSMAAGHLVFSAINGAYLAILLLAFSQPRIAHTHSVTPQTGKSHSLFPKPALVPLEMPK